MGTHIMKAARAGLACLLAGLAACGGSGDDGGVAQSPATITTQPAAQTVDANQNASFTVAVGGLPAPAIRWRLNAAELSNGVIGSGPCAGATAAGATTPTLVLSAVPASCSGAVVSASASNGVGAVAVSANVALTVNPPAPPVVLTEAADRSVSAPATALFSAMANGVPAPTVRWQETTDWGMNWHDIPGATHTDYSTGATSAADNGKRFRPVFSNGNSTVYGLPAQLTVVTPLGNTLSLLAGSTGGPGSVDGVGPAARINTVEGLATDAAGNVYIADLYNHAIRKMALDGTVSTLAGLAGASGYQDGTGSAARFYAPRNLAVDAQGNVFVADSGNSLLRKVTPQGVVSTLAGAPNTRESVDGVASAARFGNILALAFGANGTLYIVDNSAIRTLTPDGKVNTLAGVAGETGSADGAGAEARFDNPAALTVDPAGNLYVADASNYTLRKVTPAGLVSTLAGKAGESGSTNGNGGDARFGFFLGVAMGLDGNLLVADTDNQTLRRVTLAGVVSTLAGQPGGLGDVDGTGAAARFTHPAGVAIDAAGNAYVADTRSHLIRKVTPAGVVSTAVGVAPSPKAADGTGASARFQGPMGLAADAAGNVYVADALASQIRKITPAGVATAVGGATPGFYSPGSVAASPDGTLYVADTANRVIRKVTAAGVVTTLAGLAGSPGSDDGTGAAARFNIAYGIAVDAAGTIYVADTGSHTIRKITPAGTVTTLAGKAGESGAVDGTGAAARFYNPYGLAADAAGNVYVADTSNGTLRKITPDGAVSTIAGTAGQRGSSDGTGSAARFDSPMQLVIGPGGVLHVCDSVNNNIRRISADGVVTTVVGALGNTGTRLGPDGRLDQPDGLALLSANRLAVSSGQAVLIVDLP